MNQTLLARLIGMMFRAPEPGNGGGGGGGGGGDVQVTPADARTYLSDFGHNADTLKGMQDADVLKLHKNVSTAYSKRVESDGKAAKEKADKEAQAKTAAAKQAWEKGEIKLQAPQGSKLVQTDIDRIAATARERGLSKEQADELIKQEHEFAERYATTQAEAAKKQREGWVEAIKNDKDIGGANLARTQKRSQAVIDTFMPEKLRIALRETGLGDHPEFVRFLDAVGAAMDEDSPAGGGGGGGGNGKKSAEEVLYGSQTT